MSNYKKYIRVNNDWEELCQDPIIVMPTFDENSSDYRTFSTGESITSFTTEPAGLTASDLYDAVHSGRTVLFRSPTTTSSTGAFITDAWAYGEDFLYYFSAIDANNVNNLVNGGDAITLYGTEYAATPAGEIGEWWHFNYQPSELTYDTYSGEPIAVQDSTIDSVFTRTVQLSNNRELIFRRNVSSKHSITVNLVASAALVAAPASTLEAVRLGYYYLNINDSFSSGSDVAQDYAPIVAIDPDTGIESVPNFTKYKVGETIPLVYSFGKQKFVMSQKIGREIHYIDVVDINDYDNETSITLWSYDGTTVTDSNGIAIVQQIADLVGEYNPSSAGVTALTDQPCFIVRYKLIRVYDGEEYYMQEEGFAHVLAAVIDSDGQQTSYVSLTYLSVRDSDPFNGGGSEPV